MKNPFNIGDQVAVLDEDISGIIVAIDNNAIRVETDDGFVLEFLTHQLIKIDDKNHNSFYVADSDAFLDEKRHADQNKKSKKGVKLKKKERVLPALEVDLHIHKLIDSTKGMTKHDILTFQLDTARHKLEFAIRNKIQKLVFIHGVGEGVLKLELDYLLGRYDNIKYYDADYQKYGVGATEIYVFQNAKRS